MEFVVHQRFAVSGMHCAACATSVSSLLKTLSGVANAEVHFATESVVVDFNPASVGLQQFHQTLQPFGFDVEPIVSSQADTASGAHERYVQALRRDTVLAWIGAIPIVTLSMVSPGYSMFSGLVQALLCFMLLGTAGRGFFLRAWKQLRVGSTSMDTLIALSTSLAFGWSVLVLVAHDWLERSGVQAHFSFESAAMVLAFVLTGKVLEERARDHSRSALDSLQSLQPRTATVVLGNRIETRSIADVQSGDIVIVSAGETVPADGLVVSGSSACDESMLSGESDAIPKAIGSFVFAGTLNVRSALRMEVRSVGEQTMLASIRTAVLEAQESKVAAQRMVDFVSARFVPAVIVLSVLSLLLWSILGGTTHLAQAVSSLIAVLVVACPCALGLAAPIAVVLGIGRAARRGILIRSAEQLERACSVSDIVFDKTGTLSQPMYAIRDIIWYIPESEQQRVIDLIYSAELHSQHPHARALRDALQASAKLVVLDEVEEIATRGMLVRTGDTSLRIGTLDFAIEEMPGSSYTPEPGVFVSEHARMLCRIPSYDGVLTDDALVLRKLEQSGYRLHLLSGDTAANVERVAHQCGIERWSAAQSPRDKEQYISALQLSGAVVAMVGDGVNDAQSLVRADISVAMGKGTDTAVNASGIVLLRNEISLLREALNISLSTRRIIRENLVWAFLYNVLLIPLAAGLFIPFFGLRLDPMYAGAAMALSSISVVTNSLRLRTMSVDS